jgi:hypothetical protein
MKKVFISQPMNGKSNAEIMEERKDVVRVLSQNGYEVLNSVTDNFDCLDSNNPALMSLGHSLEIMAEADAALFMTGWSRARGCQIEHEAALLYGFHPDKFNRFKNLKIVEFLVKG